MSALRLKAREGNTDGGKVILSHPARRCSNFAERSSGGFTMIELVVAMSILGILVALGTPAWTNYQRTQEQLSASKEIVSVLRNAQVRAVAEERLYRVDINTSAKSLTVFRYDDAGTAVQSKVVSLEGARTTVAQVAFSNSPAAPTSVFFRARGTASDGQVVVGSTHRNRQYTVTVEGLTGRVTSS